MSDDEKFDHLQGQSPEQQEAADDVEPHIEDAAPADPDPRRIDDADGERARTGQPGL
jgi:hypothetical protein